MPYPSLLEPAIPKSAAPRGPASVAVHCLPVPPQETLKHSSGSVSVGSLGPGVHKVCLNPLNISGGYGFDSKRNFVKNHFTISICQQIWKTQQWPQDWKRSVFILIPKKGNTKECSTATAAKSLQSCPTLCNPIALGAVA